MPTADARQSDFAPSFARRDGGFLILSTHFGAAAPSSNDAVPSPNATVSVPSFAAISSIALKGIVSLRPPPRNCTTSVSSRAVPLGVRPLNRATHFASAPMSSHLQQPRALRRRESFNRVPQRRPRNGRSVRAEVALEPPFVGLARFAQHPADRLLDQVFLVA